MPIFTLALSFISSKNQLSPIKIGITQINDVVPMQIRHAIKFFTPPAPGASFIKAFKTKFCPGRCPRTFLRQKSCFIKLAKFRKFSHFVLNVGQLFRRPT